MGLGARLRGGRPLLCNVDCDQGSNLLSILRDLRLEIGEPQIFCHFTISSYRERVCRRRPLTLSAFLD